LLIAALGAAMALPPIAQDMTYHAFADQRAFLGIPNFFNVSTNLAFLAVGVAGVRLCIRASGTLGARWAWMTCFTGVVLVCFGSSYYHVAPDNDTLVWDRLPMSIGFMALLVAVVAEHVDPRLEKWLLAPAVLFGIASVIYWRCTGDLRLYVLVQFLPLFMLPLVLLLFTSPYTHRGLLLLALAIYLLSKVAEHYDAAVFAAMGETLSGHALKHLLAALSLLVIYWMLRRRRVSS